MSTRFPKSTLRKVDHPKYIPLRYRPPALVSVYRPNRPTPPPSIFKATLPNVARKPLGVQQSVYLKEALQSQCIDGKPFILPLQKVTLQYCDIGGSSQAQREFITGGLLKQFAAQNPGVEVLVQPRPFRHPLIRAEYWNAHSRSLCVRHLKSGKQVMQMMQEQVRDGSSGLSPLRPKSPVMSEAVTESVRGIWTPFRDPKLRVDYKPQAPRHLYSNNY